MVKRIVIDRVLEFLKAMPRKAMITMDGMEKEVAFHSQLIEDDTVKTYIYLDDGHGKVTRARLVDQHGIELDDYQINIEPSEDGLMVVFTLAVKVKGNAQA